MKKIITLLLILVTLPFYAQWVQQNSGVNVVLNDVYCVSEDFVVVVGENGTILKTTDGGVTWMQKASGTTQNLTKVQFTNANVGYAAANTNFNGTLLKTIDGGETWNSVAAAGTAVMLDLSIIDENIVYIITGNYALEKSINGGESFEVVNTNDLYRKVQFINEQVGYASSGVSLIKTIDGGITWSTLCPMDGIPGDGSFFFVNEQVGFVNTTDNLTRTTDGGLTFTYLDTIEYTMCKLFAPSENVVWGVTVELILSNISDQTMRGEILAPGDFQRISGTPFFKSIYFANETIGYATDFDGNIFKNTTGTMLSINHLDENSSYQIFPNPTSDQIAVSFKEEQSEPFSVKIVNTLGKEIFSEDYAPTNFVTIDTKSFSKGIYLLSITIQEKTKTQKIIIN